MMDLKTLRSALEQLEEERGIPQDKILGAIEDALVAAYKKDYGKKSQIIRAHFDLNTGTTEFYQVKLVVDESMLENAKEDAALPLGSLASKSGEGLPLTSERGEPLALIHFNEDQHLLLEDAQKIKRDARAGEEMTFPLETKDDYGRIAAQTAKQVIIQRIREAERQSVLQEFSGRAGDIVNGKVQKIERGHIFVDLGRVTGLLPYEEQIPNEHYAQGERIKCYLVAVEDTPRGVNLRLSRAQPKFVEKLFALEAPELASGAVEIKAIAREAGSRTKIAVSSRERNIDPVGSCVGQRGVRVNTVISELGGEKIDIIEWSDNPTTMIENALSPATVKNIILNEENREAVVEVIPDQFSLAVGKRGQNVRLAAKLTSWRIDIRAPGMEAEAEELKIEDTALPLGSPASK
ncbi:MAG TPA: transcription termination factor NusA [Candidatus Paceibacterota bacterium]